ncbi:TIGR03067 domain-containing protein [Lignipirellula cremea]|uniref:TIGR03067 domain-containing protein n=1 Tax=Lignipirellula cremea TaxID=2528010 RepID=A0A518DVZ6_9BACT|nr:TIGR03067 domain-containing protein [Lignipirellula cremea]QDU96010.1 hypothetical protein Pla8534_38290 [Lignipirellula cremea]
MRLGLVLSFVFCMLFTSAVAANDGVLNGTWTLIRGEAEGKVLSDSEITGGKLVIDGSNYTVTLPSIGTMTGVQTVDLTANPKTIDITNTTGANEGKTCLGLFQLHGNEYQCVFAAPGQPRPTSFKTEAGSGHWMHVWKHNQP